MTKMAATPIYGKNPSKIFFSGTGWPISTKLDTRPIPRFCIDHIKIVQMMHASPIPIKPTNDNSSNKGYTEIFMNISYNLFNILGRLFTPYGYAHRNCKSDTGTLNVLCVAGIILITETSPYKSDPRFPPNIQ